MKKILALIAALILAAGCATSATAGLNVTPGTPVHTHSDANTGGGSLNLSGTLSSTKACASGYLRLGPNYCIRTAAYAATSLVNGTCTAVAAPAGAVAVSLDVILQPASQNVAGATNNLAVDVFSDATCANQIERSLSMAYEFVATPANNVLLNSTSRLTAPVVSGNARLKLSVFSPNGAAVYAVVGYYD